MSKFDNEKIIAISTLNTIRNSLKKNLHRNSGTIKELGKTARFFLVAPHACRILVVQPGTEPKSLAMKALTPNHRV